MDGKVAVITGATSGIGQGRRGAIGRNGIRNRAGGAGPNPEVRHVAHAIGTTEERIDVLLNNAGAER